MDKQGYRLTGMFKRSSRLDFLHKQIADFEPLLLYSGPNSSGILPRPSRKNQGTVALFDARGVCAA
jgi:hypothetical protein